MQVFPPRHGRPSVGALWLLAAIVAIPRAAQAGCGAEHPRPVVDLALLARSDAFDRGDLPTAPRGCPGGLCSNDRPAPITPPAPAPPRLEMWPILEAAWDPRVPASAFDVVSGPLAYLGPIPAAPDRPPRRP